MTRGGKRKLKLLKNVMLDVKTGITSNVVARFSMKIVRQTKGKHTKKKCAKLNKNVINKNMNVTRNSRLTRAQYTVLENNFNLDNKLTVAQKENLAEELGLEPKKVKVWYQNRRAKSKRMGKKVDYELLKKENEKLIKENESLKKQVEELLVNFGNELF